MSFNRPRVANVPPPAHIAPIQHVRMYVCMHVSMYVCTYVRTHSNFVPHEYHMREAGNTCETNIFVNC